MIKAWYCHNPECGDGDKRTEIGRRIGRLLIVESSTQIEITSYGRVVVCPRCDEYNYWDGMIARKVDQVAA